MATLTFGRTGINNLEFRNSGVLLTKLEAVSDGLAILSSNSGTVELQGISDPMTPTSAASKAYVDALLVGVKWKSAVVVATDAPGTLATSFSSGEVVNGVTLVLADRILIKDQVDRVENGIYIVTAGVPTRAADMPDGSGAHNVAVYATGGIICSGCSFICVSPAVADIVGTDPVDFVVLSVPREYLPGAGIDISGVTISVDNTVVQTSGNFILAGILTHNADVKFATTAAATFADEKLLVQHSGTDGTITNTIGDLLLENSSVTGSIVTKLGTITAATDFQVQDSSGGPLFEVDGAGQGTLGGNLDVVGGIDITTNVPLTVGTAAQLSFGFDGTNSSLTTSTGDILIENTSVTGSVVSKLGTDTAATDFQVQDSNGVGLFSVNGSGQGTLGGNLDVVGGIDITTNVPLTVGTAAQLSFGFDGTNSSLTTSTGDILIENTSVTGSVVSKLGTDTAATDFQVQDSNGVGLFSVNGSGQGTLGGNLDVVGGIDITTNVPLTVGTTAQLSLVFNGTDSSLTTSTGDILIENTSVTGRW